MLPRVNRAGESKSTSSEQNVQARPWSPGGGRLGQAGPALSDTGESQCLQNPSLFPNLSAIF